MLRTVEAPLAIAAAHRPFVILAIGVNGTGKTTTVGKLAHRLKAKGHTVLLAAADTFRAAAVEQLQEWGERAQVPVVAQDPGADPAAVVHDALVAARARGIDVVLADTAGRLHTAAGLMDELEKIKRVIQRFDATAPHEVLLVLDGSQGQNALAQALKFHERLKRHGRRHHEARRHGERRHPARDRAPAQSADPARRRRRRCRGPRRFPRRRVRAGAARRRPVMIRFENVYKRYPTGREALSGVSFNMERGEFVFLTGPSGAGKSTLLRLIALIERPTRGTVLVNNQNTARIARRKIPPFRQRLGVVFQDHKLLYDRSVFDNVALPLVIAGASRREIEKRVRAALDQVGLRGRESHAPITLSTGEQQRVGIARAVAPRPDVLIADEPTGNLDPELSLEIMELFTRFNEVGVTLLIATHDLELVERLPHRRVRLVAGQIAGDTSAEAS